MCAKFADMYTSASTTLVSATRPRLHASLFALCLALVAPATSGCGSVRKGSASGALVGGHDRDGDIDSLGQGGPDRDNDAAFGWAPPADAVDRQAVIALVRRYYAIAATGDGAKACTLLDPLLVDSLEERRPVREAGESARHHSCKQVLSALFVRRHRELVEDVAAFRITAVQQRGNSAVALVDFAPTRIMQVRVRRQGGTWRMDTPLDSGAE